MLKLAIFKWIIFWKIHNFRGFPVLILKEKYFEFLKKEPLKYIPNVLALYLFLYPERTLSEAKGYLNVAFFFRVRPSVRPSVRTYVRNQNCERTDSGRTDPGRT